jgi:restriction system protein
MLSPGAAVRYLRHVLVRERQPTFSLLGDETSCAEVIAAFVRSSASDFPGGVASVGPYNSVETAKEKLRDDSPALMIVRGVDGRRVRSALGIKRFPYVQLLVAAAEEPMLLTGSGIEVDPAPFTEWKRQLYAHGLRIDFSTNLLEALFGTSRASWVKAEEIIRRTGRYDPIAVPRGIQPFAVPGLLGPDGAPVRSEDEAVRLHSVIRKTADDLIALAARDTKVLYELSPRLFEEFVAELLIRQGFDVELTPASRDGGKDIYAAKSDDLGSFLWVVECKRYAPHRGVGLSVVQRVHGVAAAEGATGGIVATTSFFTREARTFQASVENRLSLRDYEALRGWIAKAWRGG